MNQYCVYGNTTHIIFAGGNADELLYYFGGNNKKVSNAMRNAPQRMQSNRLGNSSFQ